MVNQVLRHNKSLVYFCILFLITFCFMFRLFSIHWRNIRKFKEMEHDFDNQCSCRQICFWSSKLWTNWCVSFVQKSLHSQYQVDCYIHITQRKVIMSLVPASLKKMAVYFYKFEKKGNNNDYWNVLQISCLTFGLDWVYLEISGQAKNWNRKGWTHGIYICVPTCEKDLRLAFVILFLTSLW